VESEYLEEDYSGEAVELDANEATLLEKLFNPKYYLEEFERKMNGEIRRGNQWVKVRPALARSEFITKAIMNMSAIINTNNIMTNFDDEADFYSILVENVVAFLQAALDEPTIKPEDYFQVYLMYSNPLEMFARLVIGAHASDTIKQILTKTYKELPAPEPKGFSLFGGR